MSRHKFRPTRKWVETSIKVITDPNGTSVVHVPAGEKPDGVVIASMPGDMVKRADVRRGNCRVLVTITLPFREIAGKRLTSQFSLMTKALAHRVAEHNARDYQLIKTVGADGYPEWIATCMMMDRDAIAFRNDWRGDVKIDMGKI